MAAPGTSQRVLQLRPTAVNRILAEVEEFRTAGGDPVSLMRGQPDFATPPHIVAAAQKALAAGRTSYPDNRGERSLREAIAKRIERRGGGSYRWQDEILVTDGATLGVYAALAATIDPGDVVMLPEPIYDAYLSVISLVGGIAQAVPAEIVGGRFVLDPGRVSRSCGPRAKVLLLNTPWNPTGTVLTREELRLLMNVAADHDLTVISDEIYESIVYPGAVHVSPATVSDDARSRTIIVNSFSKTFAMTGWRLGYCAGPAPLIDAMFLVLQQSSRGPATFVQYAGVAALNGPQESRSQIGDWEREMLEEYADRRQLVLAALSGLPGVSVLPPEGGFFAMVDVRHTVGSEQWAVGDDRSIDAAQGSSVIRESLDYSCSNAIRRRLLHKFGVVVMHGGAYGPSAEGTLRVSFASGGENLRKGLERLREGLTEIGK